MPSSSALKTLAKGSVKVTLDRQMALRFLGYTGQSVEGDLLARFEALAKRCEQTNEGRYVWLVDQIDLDRSVFEGSGAQLVLRHCGLVLPGKECAKHVRGASKVVLLACTLGQRCEQEFRQLKAINTLDYIMYDSCASALTEAAGNAVHDILSEAARAEGLYAHARFSPGYGDLPLSVQPAFLATLNAQRTLGLTTTDTNLLVPTKSITAVVGLFKDEEVDDGSSPCDICPAFDYCSFRERGITCHGKRL